VPPPASPGGRNRLFEVTARAPCESKLNANPVVFVAVPFALAYTPMKPLQNMLVLPYEPITCQHPCRAVLNPYCRIDYQAKVWFCPFCTRRNQFPSHYAQNITETQMPGEVSETQRNTALLRRLQPTTPPGPSPPMASPLVCGGR